MAAYQLYNFSFDSADQRNCLATGDWKEELKMAQFHLQCGLGELFTTKEKHKKEAERLENYVECSKEFITSLIICNNKKHKYQEKKEDRELDYHPGCRVIIDNRPGIRQIAIENSPSFDRKPDSVKKILERAMNRIMDEKELKVEIRPMRKEGEFFDYIEEQIDKFDDKIKVFKLEMPSEEKIRQLDLSDELMDKFIVFNSINAMVNAKKGVYTASAGSNKELRMDREKVELVQMVSACIVSGYEVSVKFCKAGTYKSSSMNKLVEVMKDGVITEFKSGDQLLIANRKKKSELEEWLDNVRDIASCD